MPISGFKTGMQVLTPSGRRATVKRVTRSVHPESVLVAFYGEMLADRWFRASALRIVNPLAEAEAGGWEER